MDCSDSKNFYNKECNNKLQEIENENRKEFERTPDKNEFLYPSLDDPNFNEKISIKKEFADTKYDGTIYDVKKHSNILMNSNFELAPHQVFVKNFLSTFTPYRSLLLYHGLGSGKTCSAIGVSEEMRDYYSQLGIDKKIIIVASPNVQDNFKLQLFDERKLKEVNGSWNITGCIGNKLLREINPTNMKGLTKEKLVSMVKSIINHYYTFTGYIQFSNEIELYKKENKIRELKKKFNDCLIIIDEVHNITLSKDNIEKSSEKKKKTGPGIGKNLLYLISQVKSLKLLLLSATPMFNNYKDIIWIINLLNLNDGRALINIKDVFDNEGNFIKSEDENKGKKLFLKKSTGYISFVRGENPYLFPFRVYPIDFSENSSLSKTFVYPKYQLNCLSIPNDKILKKLDLFISKIGNLQSYGYNYAVYRLREKLFNLSRKSNKKTKTSLGFLDLQIPLECLNIVYPSVELQSLTYKSCTEYEGVDIRFNEDTIIDSNTEEEGIISRGGMSNNEDEEDEDDEEGEVEDEEGEDEEEDEDEENLLINARKITGSEGLKLVMDYTDTITPSEKGNFAYKSNLKEKIFSYENIGKYSSKIKKILDSIIYNKNGNVSEGITLIYSSFIDGGLIPMALALEELGLNKLGGKNLFKQIDKENDKVYQKMKKFNYVMITGDSRISPNNNQEVKILTSSDNVNGDKIKVVLISVAGSEGLDFKFIRQIHIMEPWYNTNRVEQIVGRGVRNMSHKEIDFEKRNVQIFLHGTELENKEEEATDLYIYRLAEEKAIKIGKISRVLKENAVDCIINHDQTNFKEENFENQTIIQYLSNGEKLENFKIGDKSNSATCDYMEECDFTCYPDKPIEETKQNLDTYNVDFMLVNSDKLKVKIKSLFTQRFFYKKKELWQLINYPKSFPIEQIYASLSSLIEDRSEKLIDKYGREGYLVNIDEYYLFQPIELNDNNISLFDRSVPIQLKTNKLEIISKNISKTKKESDQEDQIEQNTLLINAPQVEEIEIIPKSNIVKNVNIKGKNIFNTIVNLYKLTKSSTTISRGEENWYKICGVVIIKLVNEGVDLKKLQDFLISHIIESLMFEEKKDVLNYITSSNISDIISIEKNSEKIGDKEKNEDKNIKKLIVEKLNKYFTEKTIQSENLTALLFVDGPNLKKNIKMLIKRNNRWVDAEPEDERDLLIAKNEKYPKITNFSQYVGFIGFEDKNKYMIFKVKDTFQQRNKGSRCDQAGKAKTLTLLNKIVGREEYTKENTRGQVQLELCVRQEFLLRNYNSEKKDGKIWFVSTEEAVLNSF